MVKKLDFDISKGIQFFFFVMELSAIINLPVSVNHLNVRSKLQLKTWVILKAI